MDMNSIDMNKLLNVLSKMDKKQLETGLQQIQKIIDTKNQSNN